MISKLFSAFEKTKKELRKTTVKTFHNSFKTMSEILMAISESFSKLFMLRK